MRRLILLEACGVALLPRWMCSARRLKKSSARPLKNVTAQVLVFGDLCQLLRDVGRIYLDCFLLQLRSLEGNFIQYAFQYGVQPARPDIFRLLVDHHGETSQPGDRVVTETQFHSL